MKQFKLIILIILVQLPFIGFTQDWKQYWEEIGAKHNIKDIDGSVIDFQLIEGINEDNFIREGNSSLESGFILLSDKGFEDLDLYGVNKYLGFDGDYYKDFKRWANFILLPEPTDLIGNFNNYFDKESIDQVLSQLISKELNYLFTDNDVFNSFLNDISNKLIESFASNYNNGFCRRMTFVVPKKLNPNRNKKPKKIKMTTLSIEVVPFVNDNGEISLRFFNLSSMYRFLLSEYMVINLSSVRSSKEFKDNVIETFNRLKEKGYILEIYESDPSDIVDSINKSLSNSRSDNSADEFLNNKD